jgi:hypothetical protein
MYKIDVKGFTFLFRKEYITRSIQWPARNRQPDSFFEIVVLHKLYYVPLT